MIADGVCVFLNVYSVAKNGGLDDPVKAKAIVDDTFGFLTGVVEFID